MVSEYVESWAAPNMVAQGLKVPWRSRSRPARPTVSSDHTSMSCFPSNPATKLAYVMSYSRA